MKTIMPASAALSMLYVVYPGRATVAVPASTPFYVWGKRSLAFCRRPSRPMPRGH